MLHRRKPRRGRCGAPSHWLTTVAPKALSVAWSGSIYRSATDLHQINVLAREDNPLGRLDIPRYRPQAKSHLERIDTHGAPKRQFAELVLQRMAVAAERYAVAIGRFHPRAAVRARTHMRGLRGRCFAANNAG